MSIENDRQEVKKEQEQRVDIALKDIQASSYDIHILAEAMRDMHVVLSEILFMLTDDYVQARAEEYAQQINEEKEDIIDNVISSNIGRIIRK